MRNTRLVIPEALQKEAVMIAHEGHQGMTKTKTLIRSKVWFPNMDTHIESFIRSCHECAINTPSKNFEPLKMSKLPDGPWLDVSMDFCGPLPTGDYLIVIIDEFSRFPVV